MLGHREASAPPMNNIACFNVDLIGVHPIHELLIGMQFLEDFTLFPSIVPLHLHLSYALLLQKFRLIGKASQNHLVSSQVHDRIGKNIEYFRKHLLHQLVGLVESDIERTHKASAKRAGHSLIFGSKAPAGRVARSIEFRHNSNSSPEAILHDCSGLLCGVGFLGGVAGIVGDFWMRVEDEWEGVLVDDMPVEDVEFVVHHGVDGLENHAEGQVVPRSVNHQSAINKRRLVGYLNRQIDHFALFVAEAGAPYRLNECFQSPHKTHISLRLNRGLLLADANLVAFLFQRKHAFQLRVFYLHIHHQLKPNHFLRSAERKGVVWHTAAEALLHLKLNQFCHVRVTLFFYFHIEEYPARIIQGQCFSAAFEIDRHWQVIHSLAFLRLGSSEIEEDQ